jgi:hypothetical protein
MSFSGAELQKDHLDAVASGQRSALILGLTPAMLP